MSAFNLNMNAKKEVLELKVGQGDPKYVKNISYKWSDKIYTKFKCIVIHAYKVYMLIKATLYNY